MPDHIANREQVLLDLRAELIGPNAQGPELNLDPPPQFETRDSLFQPWREKGTGEEILGRDTPGKRYGVGVLYPKEDLNDDKTDVAGTGVPSEESSFAHTGSAAMDDKRDQRLAEIAKRAERNTPDDDVTFDMSAANSYRPRAMAISFLASFPPGSTLRVDVPTCHPRFLMPANGRYAPIKIKPKATPGTEMTFWVRRQIRLSYDIPADDLLKPERTALRPAPSAALNLERLQLSLEILSRPQAGMGDDTRLLTVNLVNRTEAKNFSVDEGCLFQAYFRAEVCGPDGQVVASILPYPAPRRADEEELSNELLYRSAPTFAIGHGCAADWSAADGLAHSVSAECLPVYETPSITPDITRADGSAIDVSMAGLAGLQEQFNIGESLQEICSLYESWIDARAAEVPLLPPHLHTIAHKHLDACRSAGQRMQDGLAYLLSNPQAMQAFKWANHAVLLQQVRGTIPPRTTTIDPAQNRVAFSEPFQAVNALKQVRGRGTWRAFQIAFLLMSIRSAVEADAPDRDTVDLIWFPTGGGKTEAYLGLSAFALFMRRLRSPGDAGVHVLMRYTLRLLTAQQFQRATGLICAMEYLRRRHEPQLGSTPFSAGIWLGSATTPNTHKDAREQLKALKSGSRYAENPFMVTRCPWCAAQMGPVHEKRGKSKGKGKTAAGGDVRVFGYELDRDTFIFRCPDPLCDFGSRPGLPIFVVDEDVYEQQPSLVIGTVDKFAMLAWKPQARALFGLAEDGVRVCSPPGLIIQDELHLISGPLGSVSGLYEPVIQELCTDHRSGRTVRPKLVCSTATIRAYQEQIRSLYGRSQAALFPPPGLDAGDSFFSRYAVDAEGKLRRGRMYVGVHGPGHGSMQTTQVRTFSALLQSPHKYSYPERDPWWTLLVFFNSLRELGTTLTLLQSDIPDYLNVMKTRYGTDPKQLRYPWNVMELTGRLNSEEVPRAITELETVTSEEKGVHAVDVCLASNIIEVGIDITRLSLMAIVGQPKTTAQYIQVSGRVGRNWPERPGLVVTLYNASKPRDRSHFEKFRTYHQQLYAQVEPTSVTPFSPQALERALHAAMTAYVRQTGPRGPSEEPNPFPAALVSQFAELVRARVSTVDPAESENLEKVLARRASEWQRWQRLVYKAAPDAEDPGLLTPAGEHVSPVAREITWMTPQSMRSVDAECQAEITTVYLNPAEATHA